MVEAAGVEPASENVTGQETTCLFAFRPQALGAIAGASPGTFTAPAQNGQETVAASLKISSSLPRRSREDQPAVRRPSEAHGPSLLGRLPKLVRLRMPFLDWQLSFCPRLRVCAPRHASWPQASPSKP
jgi:hypothetical protein